MLNKVTHLEFPKEENKLDVDSNFSGGRQKSQTEVINWQELRISGKCPDRRAYHSTFSYMKK